MKSDARCLAINLVVQLLDLANSLESQSVSQGPAFSQHLLKLGKWQTISHGPHHHQLLDLQLEPLQVALHLLPRLLSRFCDEMAEDKVQA